SRTIAASRKAFAVSRELLEVRAKNALARVPAPAHRSLHLLGHWTPSSRALSVGVGSDNYAQSPSQVSEETLPQEKVGLSNDLPTLHETPRNDDGPPDEGQAVACEQRV